MLNGKSNNGDCFNKIFHEGKPIIVKHNISYIINLNNKINNKIIYGE